MIVVAVVVGIALALCVAGWVPLVRDALRTDHVLPGPAVREAVAAVVAARPDPEPLGEAVPESVTV
ncbi:hypothetical protein ACXR2U_10105 [Jatrophihabitans sp. YIM 134969]